MDKKMLSRQGSLILCIVVMVMITNYAATVQKEERERAKPTPQPTHVRRWDLASQVVYHDSTYVGSGPRGKITDEYTQVGRIVGVVPSYESPVEELTANVGKVGDIVYKKGDDEERIYICFGEEEEMFSYDKS